MNSLTRDGVSHDFTTLPELLALIPPGITHVYRDGLTLVGYDAIPTMHILGTLKQIVAVPKLRMSQRVKP